MADQRMEMQVAGMTCGQCEHHVTRALEEAGVRVLKANWRRSTVEYLAPDDLDSTRLAKAVKSVGYEPGPVRVLETVVSRTRPSDGNQPDYDLAIIGSGSAAFAAAIKATELGHRVVMVERGTVGGTCVNIGCVPSKAFLRAAETYYHAAHPSFAGIRPQAASMDLAELVAQKDELVATLRQEKYTDLVADYGWELRAGNARFLDDATLEVDGLPLRAKAYLIATGASPSVPPISGLSESGFMTSTDALDLSELPRSMAVIGANAIGLELGQAFQMMGAK